MQFIDYYFEELFDKIALVFPDIKNDSEIKEIIRDNILNEKVTLPVSIENNYTQKTMHSDTESLLNIMYVNKPTISGYGVLFHNRDKKENIPGQALDYLLSERKVFKKLMLKHENDEDKTLRDNYNILQLVLKLLANSVYGAYGEKSFHFFNAFLGPSVTYTGRRIIAAAILGFESLLADNYYFESLDEIIHFIYNVNKEPLKYNLDLNFNISKEKLLQRFLSKCSFNISNEEIDILKELFNNLPQLAIDRLYMKNNLSELLNDNDVLSLFSNSINEDYLNFEKIPNEIEDDLNLIYELIDFYVSYIYQYPNAVDRAATLVRKVILVTDTDSTFIYLDPLIKKVKSNVSKKKFTKAENTCIVNLFTHCITKFIERVFYNVCTNYNVVEKDRHRISMKNEFLFERVVLTENKKQYAAKLLMKEGIIYDKPKYEIKGLQIKKVGTPKVARDIFKKILEDDILNKEEIKPLEIYKKFIKLEKQVEESLKECKTEFLKPGKFNSVKSYAAPLTQQAVRGVLLWNALYPSNAIQNMSKVWLLKFKNLEVDDLKNYLPENLIKSIEENYFTLDIKAKEEKENAKTIKDYKLEVLAIPKEIEYFPKEFLPLIDDITIVNDIIKNGNILLESIGFTIINSFEYKTAANTIMI